MNIQLIDFFTNLQEENYCITKRGDIEKYQQGSDLDIFCMNLKSFSEAVIDSMAKYIENGYEVVIHEKRGDHRHIDIVKNNILEIRFDLYGSIPSYKKINIKDALFTSVIENRVTELVTIQGSSFSVFFPSLIDEVLIRYIEYIENYELRPDKVKHLDYILKEIESDQNIRMFLNKLHYYTKIPNEHEVVDLSMYKKIIQYFSYIWSNALLLPIFFKNHGLRETLKKIKNKVF